MEDDELIISRKIIDRSADNQQAGVFKSIINNMTVDELEKISDYLNAGVPPGSSWQDYWFAFVRYEWYEFTNAYERVMGRRFWLQT